MQIINTQRRNLLSLAAASGALGSLGLAGCAAPGAYSSASIPAKTRVLVVGGGYGGATAAKYVRLFSDYTVDVVMVEPNPSFISCPISNLVIAGNKQMSDITMGYGGLAKHGVKVVKDMVAKIDAAKKTATLASGAVVAYDKLIVSPGIDMMWDSVQGLQAASQSGQILQAWKAGSETMALRKQLQDMKDGGVYAIAIPEAPYRCPPGPYERASVVAAYLKANKPKSKVIILDANQDVVSKAGLFKKAWNEKYKGMVEYRPQHKAMAVDAKTNTVKFDVQDDVKADVLNVLPTMRAGKIAVDTGLANSNGRWCNVNYLNFESTAAKDVHVIGDAIQVAPLMPKSGHMANSHAKVTAAAIVAELAGLPINQNPMLTNTCYSFVSMSEAVHVASVHSYVAAEKTFKTVAGSGGVSAEIGSLEGVYAMGWATNIWADSLA